MSRPVANDDRVVSLAEAEVLVREIERLRAELDKLETRVDQLDELAHKDPLVHLPNRRSFIASLERPSGDPLLRSAPVAIDLSVLKLIAEDPAVAARRGPMARRLWAACGLPASARARRSRARRWSCRSPPSAW